MGRFGALGAVNDLERNFLALGKGLVAFTLDLAEVHEDISPVFPGNEPKAFGFIEPFHGSFYCHCTVPPFHEIEECGNSQQKSREVESLRGHS